MKQVRDADHCVGRFLARRGMPSGDVGSSLAELLVAMSVLAVVMVGIGAGVSQGLVLVRNNHSRIVAANLANQEMEILRTTPFEDVPVGRTVKDPAPSVGGLEYTLERDIQWIPRSATTSACLAPTSGPGSGPAYLRVGITVSWPGKVGSRPVRSDTVLTPPVTAYSATAGHVAVTVTDRLGQPAALHAVRVEGPGSPPVRFITTNAEGCAFFAFLPAGTYTVSLDTNSPTTHIDQASGGPNPIKTVTVAAGGATAAALFVYDRQATLRVDPEPPLGTESTTAMAPPDVAYTLSNTDLPSGTKVFAGNGEPRELTGLFPYPSGYGVWAGKCPAANPTLNGATSLQTFATEPGEVTDGTLTTALVRLRVVDALGAPRSGRPATATMDTGDGCVETLPLGSSNALGEIVVAMPYGPWQFRAGGPPENAVLTTASPLPLELQVLSP
jgi:hypothetical protein